MRLSANVSLLYPGLPLDARLAGAARDGFAAVEIQFPYDVAPHDLAARLQTHGLTLVLVNTPAGAPGESGLAALPGREADFLAALHQALAVCAATDCRTLHVMAGKPAAGADTARVRATLLANLRLAARLAREAGVTLTLEPLNRHDVPGYAYHQPADVTPILAELDEPGVRLQFDVYHVQREGLDLQATLAAALPRVHHVQFAHVQGRHEPDPADPAVAGALRQLMAAGYAGWIGAEYVPAGDVTAGLARWVPDYRRVTGQDF